MSSEPAGPWGGFRHLEGLWAIIAKVFFSLVPLAGIVYCLHIPEGLGFLVMKEQYLALFLSLLLSSCFLIKAATKTASRVKPPWYDVVFALLSLVTGLYITILYPQLVFTRGFVTLLPVILSAITIILLLEAARRVFGWMIVIVVAFSILYARYAYLLPGMLSCREISWDRLLTYLYLDPGALLGIPLAVAAIIVLGFIFFGRFLFGMGGGQFLMDIALAMMGKYRGGPAKGAVVASALFGTMSGSAAANVAMTGTVTIPMMKRMGYQSHFAAGVESVASIGGVFLPPVMGAVAFIMAEFLEISYAKVAIAALIPAILYFTCIFVQVDIEAVKEGLKGLPREQLPSVKNLMKQGWYYALPLIVLVYALFVLYLRPETSAIYAVGVALLIFIIKNIRGGKLVFRKLLAILEDTGRGLLELAVIAALAGFIIGVLSVTGLAITFSSVLIAMSGGHILVLLVFAAIGAIIIGMGMPIAATYIMLAILIAPALIQLGVEPLAAHLFIMYFGGLSFLTPPICVAVYVGAGIAGSEPMRTALLGMRLGLIAYVVPFIFVYDTGLLLMGSMIDIMLVTVSSLIGVILLAGALGGYLFDKLNLPKRIWLGLGAFGLLMPNSIASVVGLGLVIPLILWQWRAGRASRLRVAEQQGHSPTIKGGEEH